VGTWEGKESESFGYVRGRYHKVSDLEKIGQKIGDMGKEGVRKLVAWESKGSES
jgi:hypothetical protein